MIVTEHYPNVELTFNAQPASLPVSSRVQFARFEYETAADAPIQDRKLMQRANKRKWLSPVMVEQMLLAQRLPGAFKALDGTENVIKRTRWWGEYHKARTRVSRFVDLPVSFNDPFRRTRLWLAGSTHQSSWDAQALPSQKTEFVLNGFVNSRDEAGRQQGEVYEFAALMIDDWKEGEHRLVLQGPEGWHEPTAPELGKAESMLFAMTYIALNELNRA